MIDLSEVANSELVKWTVYWREVASLSANRKRSWRQIPDHRQTSKDDEDKQQNNKTTRTTKQQKQQNNKLEQQNNENDYLQLQSGDFDRFISDRGNSFRIAEFILTTTKTNYY